MSDQKTKKLTRRDAIKLLGAAAGASVLANLPAKWNSPETVSGVLPAHAQTSCLDVLFLEVLSTQDCIVAIVDGQGPAPTSGSGDGSAGSTLQWDCTASGCVAFGMELADVTGNSPSAVVQITTLTDQFIINIPASPTQWVLVDLDSGEHDENFNNVSAGACPWPFSKGNGKGNPTGWW